MGLHRAGFEVVGVDVAPQPRYPFEFRRIDALNAPLSGFDFIWASPPCQAYSLYSRNLGTADRYPDLVARVRERLIRTKKPYVIENVVGAPLKNALMLCGTMFGLPLLRHRLFEPGRWSLDFPPADCAHTGDEIPVYGNGTPQWHREKFGRNVHLPERKAAMGIDWMNRKELSQAIPPAYSEFIAREFLRGVA